MQGQRALACPALFPMAIHTRHRPCIVTILSSYAAPDAVYCRPNHSTQDAAHDCELAGLGMPLSHTWEYNMWIACGLGDGEPAARQFFPLTLPPPAGRLAAPTRLALPSPLPPPAAPFVQAAGVSGVVRQLPRVAAQRAAVQLQSAGRIGGAAALRQQQGSTMSAARLMAVRTMVGTRRGWGSADVWEKGRHLLRCCGHLRLDMPASGLGRRKLSRLLTHLLPVPPSGQQGGQCTRPCDQEGAQPPASCREISVLVARSRCQFLLVVPPVATTLAGLRRAGPQLRCSPLHPLPPPAAGLL